MKNYRRVPGRDEWVIGHGMVEGAHLFRIGVWVRITTWT